MAPASPGPGKSATGRGWGLKGENHFGTRSPSVNSTMEPVSQNLPEKSVQVRVQTYLTTASP